MQELKTTYGDFNIVYLPNTNEWKILDDGEHGEKIKSSLLDCQKYIDNLAKRKTKGDKTFPRTDALISHFGTIETVTVTSYAGMQYGRREYWYTRKNGDRRKGSGLYVYDAGKEREILNLYTDKKSIDKKLDNIIDSLAPLEITGYDDE